MKTKSNWTTLLPSRRKSNKTMSLLGLKMRMMGKKEERMTWSLRMKQQGTPNAILPSKTLPSLTRKAERKTRTLKIWKKKLLVIEFLFA